MRHLALIFSSGLGVGYFPKAPGTVGTLWGVLLFFLTRHWNLSTVALGTLLLFFLSVFLIHFAERVLKSHDSSIIVLDEVVGYLVTILWIPYDLCVAVLAFIFFRVFDIWKPFPIRQIDRKVKGAWGVVLDDVMAGVYANVVLRIVIYFWEH